MKKGASRRTLYGGCRNCHMLQDVTQNAQTVSADGQCLDGNSCRFLGAIDTDLKQVIEGWAALSEDIRQAILSLTEADWHG